jgi:homoisocitrate dehydrogenase
MTFRSLATTASKSLRIGLIPADGIGREVIPVSLPFECIFSSILLNTIQAARRTLEALGSTLPKLEFHDLLAGFDLFTRTGTALPRETVESVRFLKVKPHE